MWFLSLWLKCCTLLSSLHQQQNLQCRILHNTSFSSRTITVINLVAINRKYSFAYDVLFIFVPIARRKKKQRIKNVERAGKNVFPVMSLWCLPFSLPIPRQHFRPQVEDGDHLCSGMFSPSELIYLFNQQRFPQHFLCASHCARCWRYQNFRSCQWWFQRRKQTHIAIIMKQWDKYNKNRRLSENIGERGHGPPYSGGSLQR